MDRDEDRVGRIVRYRSEHVGNLMNVLPGYIGSADVRRRHANLPSSSAAAAAGGHPLSTDGVLCRSVPV